MTMPVFSRLAASVASASPEPASAAGKASFCDLDASGIVAEHDVLSRHNEISHSETAHDQMPHNYEVGATDSFDEPELQHDPLVQPVTITFVPAARIGATKRPAVAFEDIVEKYHGKVFQLVYRYLGDYDEACDLTQDTFVRAYSAWGEFRGESQIYTWLYRIAINLCHNQQKKLQRRRRVERASLDCPNDSDAGSSSTQWNSREVADERPLPLQVLESHEMRLRLQEALRELPENYRTAIVLRDIEGLSYEEIARITDSTLEAIKSRLFRARGAIRRLMEPYLMGEAAAASDAMPPSVGGPAGAGKSGAGKSGAGKSCSENARREKRQRFRLL
jgi:RNA polymerase sigma-70 factor (ECF subfamily)